MKNIYRLAVPILLFAFAAFAQTAVALDEYGYPSGYPNENVSNANILNDVQEALEREPGMDFSKVNVFLQNGVVYLSGTVDSRQARELAANAARSVRGVRSVDAGDLNVAGFQRGAGDTGYAMYDGNDRNLQNRVERALSRSRIDISGMNMNVRNGRVDLFGTVPSVEAKNIAVAVAHSVEGVEDVNSADLRAASDDSYPTWGQDVNDDVNMR